MRRDLLPPPSAHVSSEPVFNVVVTGCSSILWLEKQTFSHEFSHNLVLEFQVDLLYSVVSEETGVKPARTRLRGTRTKYTYYNITYP